MMKEGCPDLVELGEAGEMKGGVFGFRFRIGGGFHRRAGMG